MSDLLTRRSMLRTSALGVAAVYGLAGCGDDDASTSTGGGGGGEKASGTVTFGSNQSDPVPKKALQTVFDDFTAASSVKVDVNTVDHNTFQEQINNYLQGTPDDVFTWFAGYRMQFFAQRGLASDISDVWEKIGGNYSQALQGRLDARRQAVLHPVLQLPVGVLLQEERVREERLGAGHDARRVQGALREDQGQGHDADRVRRQGRLARDGHVRLHQHAHERLRLPQEPDGGRGGVGRPGGQAGLRHLGRAAAATTRRARSAASGRTPRRR